MANYAAYQMKKSYFFWILTIVLIFYNKLKYIINYISYSSNIKLYMIITYYYGVPTYFFFFLFKEKQI